MINSWTPAQLDILAEHHDLPDTELAVLVNAAGPARSVLAVEERRRLLGYIKPRGFSKPDSREKARLAIEREAKRREGWPRMVGKREDRERRYLTLLFEGLQEERRRAVARQEVA